ncbi:hypothetical protein FO470_05175 [Starkeya sp. 3C]|uniref:Uncharacterized protein n=1 Tax=Ancylobacter moscoviensis TaxID=2597768 RepID=A0ABY3DWV0_9HYPH|nr:hypothetical protein [Ancylobacter moscoviensis]TSJ64650.1 hypothetical protein FO470_05175 [Ancylobacter moscoviensis]
MAGFGNAAFKGSAYILGAATGIALMVPLTAGALGAGAVSRLSPQPVAIEGSLQRNFAAAPVVNRAAKGPRLDIAPAGTSTPGTSAQSPSSPPAAKAPVIESASETRPAVPARVMRTPKGCLSAIGVTKSNLATEELTVCMADASIIDRIN